jgi:hypothetical protein
MQSPLLLALPPSEILVEKVQRGAASLISVHTKRHATRVRRGHYMWRVSVRYRCLRVIHRKNAYRSARAKDSSILSQLSATTLDTGNAVYALTIYSGVLLCIIHLFPARCGSLQTMPAASPLVAIDYRMWRTNFWSSQSAQTSHLESPRITTHLC